MKRVLFLNKYGFGGAEMMTVHYAKILSQNGYKVMLMTHIRVGCENEYCPEVPKEIKYKFSTSCYIKFLWEVVKTIWTFRPNVVFTWQHTIIKNLLTPLLKYKLAPSFKLICRCPNTPSITDDIERNGFYSFKIADKVIAQTKEMEYELNNLIGIPKDKLITIINPLSKDRIHENLKENYDLDKSFTNYVAAGRISDQKDYPTMLKAFACVKQQNPRSRLYILGRLGGMELMKEIYTIIKDYGLEDSVFLEGFQQNPHKYEINADVFVMSSIYEGLPNALLEALYLGVPVAVTNCIPFISQVVENGINGFIAAVKDEVGLSMAMMSASKLKDLPRFVEHNNSENLIIDLFNNVCK